MSQNLENESKNVRYEKRNLTAFFECQGVDLSAVYKDRRATYGLHSARFSDDKRISVFEKDYIRIYLTVIRQSITPLRRRFPRFDNMDLIIKFMNGQTFSLSVEMNATVEKLKNLIQIKQGTPSARQHLSVQNGQRRDLTDESRTLAEYGVRSGSTVIVLVTEPGPIQVFLKTEKGATHTYEITPGETVSEFKGKVFDKERVPVDQQSLICNGRQMEDGKKLEDYGVKNESTIFLNMRLRGG